MEVLMKKIKEFIVRVFLNIIRLFTDVISFVIWGVLRFLFNVIKLFFVSIKDCIFKKNVKNDEDPSNDKTIKMRNEYQNSSPFHPFPTSGLSDDDEEEKYYDNKKVYTVYSEYELSKSEKKLENSEEKFLSSINDGYS